MSEEMIIKMNINEEHISELFTFSLVKITGEGNKIQGSAGLRPLWAGVYEAWLQAKDYNAFYKYKFFVIRFIKKYLNDIMNKTHAKRIQAVVKEDDVKARAFIRFLGFQSEGVLRNYGTDGSNFVMYAMVKHGN